MLNLLIDHFFEEHRSFPIEEEEVIHTSIESSLPSSIATKCFPALQP